MRADIYLSWMPKIQPGCLNLLHPLNSVDYQVVMMWPLKSLWKPTASSPSPLLLPYLRPHPSSGGLREQHPDRLLSSIWSFSRPLFISARDNLPGGRFNCATAQVKPHLWLTRKSTALRAGTSWVLPSYIAPASRRCSLLLLPCRFMPLLLASH